MPLQRVLMDDFSAAAERAGRWDLVNNPAGQIAGLVKTLRPAAEIMADMVSGAVEVIESLHQTTT